MSVFRTEIGEHWFNTKYALYPGETWYERCTHIVNIARKYMAKDEADQLEEYLRQFKWMPGGRYIYYAGREAKYFNNCYILKGEEDTREEWARLMGKSASCLLTGGGIGVDHSIFRERGRALKRTGGTASGPIPLMQAINDFGRRARQGGGRRSAIYASLNWQHGDIDEFLTIKDWKNQYLWPGGPSYYQAKMADFDTDAPLDMTNISPNYDDAWKRDPDRAYHPTFRKNIEMAMRNGEPGLSLNFGKYANETGRNACTEVSSADDSDVCNLASPNYARIGSPEELKDVCYLVGKFCIAGSLESDIPYRKVAEVRNKNRRIGVGLMGLHEWLLQRRYRYEYNPELSMWLAHEVVGTRMGADDLCDKLGISKPVAYNAIAPTGTIAGLAGTTGGIEPIFATAYKRRWLKGEKRMYEFCIDNAAQTLIREGYNPDDIESAIDLAGDVRRRLAMQAGIQHHIDMCISSTINLPAWGSELNNPDKVDDMCRLVSEFAPRLRGLTFYPDGARGGQPLTAVPYSEAVAHKGVVFEENMACKDGVCGI